MRSRHRRLHRQAWIILAVLLPAIGLAALLLRAGSPPMPPQRLAPPQAFR